MVFTIRYQIFDVTPNIVNIYYIWLRHSAANRHSCSTSAETRDRKCFSMQLQKFILVPLCAAHFGGGYDQSGAGSR